MNRKGVMFHQFNAQSHTARIASQKIKEHGWEKIPQPPFYPDLTPSDCYLFRCLEEIVF